MPKKKQASLFSPGRIIFYAFALLVFYLAVHYAGQLKDIRGLLVQISPGWLLLAFAAQLATYACNVLILRTLLEGRTGTAGFLTLFKLSVVILFVNQAMPSGGISGNGYVFGQLVKRKIAARSAFKALVLESICYYIAFLGLLGGFYGWYVCRVHHPGRVMVYTVLTGFVFFIALGGLMLVIADRRAISWLMRKLSRFARVKTYIARSGLLSLGNGRHASRQALFANKSAIALAVMFQVTVLVCDALTIFAILRGFHVPLGAGGIMLGFLLSMVIGSLPVSPGSLIAYESAMTYFFTLLGVPVHAALIVTLLFRFFSFWLPIPVGLLLYRNLRLDRM